jgi:hypothetical protein
LDGPQFQVNLLHQLGLGHAGARAEPAPVSDGQKGSEMERHRNSSRRPFDGGDPGNDIIFRIDRPTNTRARL